MEDKPTVVRNVTVRESNINDPVVKWQQPALLHGWLRHYEVDVQYMDDVSLDNYPKQVNHFFNILLDNFLEERDLTIYYKSWISFGYKPN